MEIHSQRPQFHLHTLTHIICIHSSVCRMYTVSKKFTYKIFMYFVYFISKASHFGWTAAVVVAYTAS